MGVVVLYLKFVGLTPWLLSLLLHVSCLTKTDSGDQLTERGLTAGEEHERFLPSYALNKWSLLTLLLATNAIL